MTHTKTKKLFFISSIFFIGMSYPMFLEVNFSDGFSMRQNQDAMLNNYNQEIKNIYYGESPYSNDNLSSNMQGQYQSSQQIGRSAAVISDNDGDSLYMWGDNSYGQLGRGEKKYDDLNDVTDPESAQEVVFKDQNGNLIKDYQIDMVSLGATSSAAVLTYDQEDHLYMWGDTANGQLGIADANKNYDLAVPNTGELNSGARLITEPELVASLPAGELQEIQLSNNANHPFSSALVADDVNTPNETDVIYTWGDNEYGQLGLGYNSDYVSTPGRVNEYGDNNYQNSNILINDYSLGNGSMGVIIDSTTTVNNQSDEVYLWGNNNYGQLGMSVSNTNLPKLLQLESTETITSFEQIEMSNNSTVLLAKTENEDNFLYSSGSNVYGQLGDKSFNSDQRNQFQKIEYFANNDEELVSLESGSNSYGVYVKDSSENESLYVWGDNSYGQLGLGEDYQNVDYISEPVLADINFYNDNERVRDYKMEANNSIIITISDNQNKKVLYSWGDNSIKGANPYKEDFIISSINPILTFGNNDSISNHNNVDIISSDISATTSTTFTIALVINDPNLEFVAEDAVFYSGDEKLDNNVAATPPNPDGTRDNYNFEIIDLEPNTTYDNLSVRLFPDDDSEALKDLSTTTLPYDMIEINNVKFISSDENSATFQMKVNMAESNPSDIIALHYRLTDQKTGDSERGKIEAEDLSYQSINSTYYFTIKNLESGVYYSLSNVYFELYNFDQTSTLYSPNALVGNDELYFSTDFKNSSIRNIIFLDSQTTQNTIYFRVSYYNMGSFDPEDLRVSYIKNKNFNDPEYFHSVKPTMVTDANKMHNSKIYTYKLEGLDSKSTYSDFQFFMPYAVNEHTHLNEYDYDNPDFTSDHMILTDPYNSKVNSEYGIHIDKKNAKKLQISIKFDDLETRPELVEISYYEDGNKITPESGSDMEFIEYDSQEDVYRYEIVHLNSNTSYQNATLYEPTGALYNDNTQTWEADYDYNSGLYSSEEENYVVTNVFWIWILIVALVMIIVLIILNLLTLVGYKSRKENEMLDLEIRYIDALDE